MRGLLIAAVLLAASGCEKIVATETHKPVELVKEVSCTHISYCYGMTINYKGEMTSGYRFGSCSGKQPALVRQTTTTYTYESGSKSDRTSEDIIERRGQCQ